LGEAVGEAWAEPSRIRLRNLFCETADWLGRYFYKHSEWASAIAISRRVLESDSCHESAHLLLMQCFAKQGQRSSAIRQYHALRSLLREELGISPSAETQAFFTRLIQEDREGKTADNASLAGALNPV
jgi:DNA-binding SARP family transcriptional activator